MKKKARTGHEMDAMLWAQGYIRWMQAPIRPDSVQPNELDYLRGIHNAPVLSTLSQWLSDQTKKNVRLRSMWQDKIVNVEPYDDSGNALDPRELADLAIITNFIGPTGIQRTMWLLQAKRSRLPTSNFGGKASPKEIELLERSRCFSLLNTSGAAVGKAYDAHDFHGPGHWSFLTYHQNHRRPRPGHEPFPVRMRWPGSVSPVLPVTGSFCESLVDVCNGVHGVSVDKQPSSDEWSRLYKALMEANVTRTTKYAVTDGNLDGSVMQLAAFTLDRFGDLARSTSVTPGTPMERTLMRWKDLVDRRGFFRSRSGPWLRRWWKGSFINSDWGTADGAHGADEALFLDAFGREPPQIAGGGDDGGDGDGPGFRHVLFVDVFGQEGPDLQSIG